MRQTSLQPAIQLGSTCWRYAHRAAARICAVAGGVHPPWSASQHKLSGQNGTEVGCDAADPLARLEAILLLAKEPMSSRKLAQFAGLEDGTQARSMIQRLNAEFDSAGRAFRVEEVAGGYQLLTRRKFSAWLRRLAHVPGETRLSAPALETLAVIAYRQPVLKADIDAIRGGSTAAKSCGS